MTQPNILVFLTDDHGQWASSAYGNSEIISPNMDFLARQGTRFTRACTPTPVCSPARASFYSGRFPSQHGIHDWVLETEAGKDHPGLEDQTLIGELLQNAGYETAQIGKWHCCRSAEPKKGFDRWFSYGHRQYPHKGKTSFSDQGNIYETDCFQTNVFTDKAIDYLQNRNTNKPFFMYVGYVDTHTPYSDHPERLVDYYRKHASFSDIPDETYSDAHGYCHSQWNKDTARENLSQYYAAVTMIDEQIGRIMDELDAQGELDNTLIIYTGDHGHMNGHHGTHCKGNMTVPQNFIDESIYIPQLVRLPGTVKEQVRDEFIDHTDTWATLLDLAGATVPEETLQEINSPGRSYLPILNGETPDWKDAYIGEYGNAWCIRTDDYKFIKRFPGQYNHFSDELYDLQADPRERVNCLASADPVLIQDFEQRLETFFETYSIAGRQGVPVMDLPAHNGGYEPWMRDNVE